MPDGIPIPNELGLDLREVDSRAYMISAAGRVLVDNDAHFFRRLVAARGRWGDGRRPHRDRLDADAVIVPDERVWRLVRRRMRNVIVNTTDRCNSDCRVCFKSAYPEQELLRHELSLILRRLGRHKNIVLSGGECTVRDDLPQLIGDILAAGHVPTIYTNGLRMADAAYAHALHAAGLRRMHLSMDGVEPEPYARLRNDPAQLEAKLQALDNIGALAGLDVFLSVLVVPEVNGDQIGPLLRFAFQRRRFIRGIYLLQNNVHDGRYDVSPTQWTTSDILRAVSAHWPQLDADYWLEYERFKVNLARSAARLRVPFRSPTTGVIVQADGDQLQLPFSLAFLRRANQLLEGSGALGLLPLAPLLVTKTRPMQLLRALLQGRFDVRMVRDGFYLDIHRITTRGDNLRFASDTIDVSKQDGRIVFRHGCV